MDSGELRALQAPIKDRYRSEPKAALITPQLGIRQPISMSAAVAAIRGKANFAPEHPRGRK